MSFDFAVSIDGCVADAATSFVVGAAVDPADQQLIETTRTALSAGIAAAGPHARVGDVSEAIGTVLRGAGYRVNTDFGGHGVGSTMHQDPHIPNDGRAGRGNSGFHKSEFRRNRCRPGLPHPLLTFIIQEVV